MRQKTMPPALAGVIVAILLAVLIGGYWFYSAQRDQLRAAAEHDLEAIAELKIAQIVTWREERLADAGVLARDAALAAQVADYLADPQPATQAALLTRFETLAAMYHYADVMLLDPAGQIHLRLDDHVDDYLHAEIAEALSAALQTRQPALTILHHGPDAAEPHVGAVAPLFVGADPVGAIILQSDATRFLYPLIQSWPVPSASAETLIVARDGESVVFLSNLRHQPDAALTLRIPLTETDVPAVMAVLGVEGVVTGRDYRGVEVFSVLLPVPGSEWYMVAKVDAAEVLTDWTMRSALIILLLGGALTVLGLVGWLVWQNRETAHYQRLLLEAQAHQESEARYHTTLLSIGDGVIVTDTSAQVTMLNPVAEALTGWTQAEAVGRPLDEVFPIINEETRAPVENPVHRVLREGVIVGLANHTLLLARDGREIPIADSGAPVQAADGALGGVVLVIRDQTEERAAQAALAASEERYRSLFENNHAVMLLIDPTTGAIADANPAACAYYGWSREELRQMRISAINTLSEEDIFAEMQAAQTEQRDHFRFRHRRADGAVRDVEVFSGPIEVQGQRLLYSIIHDITDQAAAEKALAASETYLRTILDNLPVGVAVSTLEPLTATYMNDNFPRFYRTTRAALEGADTFWEAVYEDEAFRETMKQRVLADIASGDPERMRWETIPITREGEETTHISATTRLIQDTGLMLSTVWDVTALKRAELKREEEHNLTRALRDIAAALISAVDLEAVMSVVLENVARVVAHDASNIMLIEDDHGRAVAHRGYPPELTGAIRAFRLPLAETENLRDMIATGEPFLVSRTEDYPAWINVPLTAWVRSYLGVPIRSHDSVIGFLNLDSATPGFFTEKHAERLRAFADLVSIAIEHAQLYERVQRHAEELEQRVIERTAQLNHSKERIEAILNSSTDVIILCRPDGRIEQVNPAFYATFRCEVDAGYNEPLHALVSLEDAPALERAFATVLETHQPQRLEAVIQWAGRASYDADIVLSPMVETGGALLGVVCSVRDVTERRRMEARLRQTLAREMELGELKSRYLSMAAHDLRNPLAVIQNAVMLLERYREKLSDDKRQEKFAHIHSSIRVMVDLLDDILTVGRAESGKLEFKPTLVNLPEFCQGLVAEQVQASGGKRTILLYCTNISEPAYLDPQLLRHILANLLSNALKYSSADTAVEFSVTQQVGDLVFVVRDHGIGIPQADQAGMFEIFHRAGNVGDVAGTGLGLAIVKQSVEMHGGTVTFESQEGIGTTFTVTIPQMPAAE